jgi:SAM-dependent methyltransferase
MGFRCCHAHQAEVLFCRESARTMAQMDRDVFEREEAFHDDWAASLDPSKVLVRESFEAPTAPENRWILGELGSLTGLKVLELGSGAGEGAVYFALQGADVIATDLSPGMVRVVSETAAHHGVTVETRVCSATDLSCFEASSFDVVYAANLLHHVDIETCLDEVLRVLRPGGRAAFWDPVLYNPLIMAYRPLASGVRTPDEHPIRRRDMEFFSNRFSSSKSRGFWFFSLAVFVRFFLFDRIDPSKERYWKKILSEADRLESFYAPLHTLDKIALDLFPFLKWLCWNIAVVAQKRG